MCWCSSCSTVSDQVFEHERDELQYADGKHVRAFHTHRLQQQASFAVPRSAFSTTRVVAGTLKKWTNDDAEIRLRADSSPFSNDSLRPCY